MGGRDSRISEPGPLSWEGSAPPAPLGGPASWVRCRRTPRSPPRPRDGENRAARRVPQLLALEPKRAWIQRTQRTFFGPPGAGPSWYTPWSLRERVQRTQGRFTFMAY